MITVERKTVTQGTTGGTKETWVTHLTIDAEAYEISGREALQYNRLSTNKVMRFKTAYNDITEKDRILFEGSYYNILNVNDPHRLHKFLLIDAEKK